MFPFLVNAYGIENFYINATVLENGDILVLMEKHQNGMNKKVKQKVI